MNLFKTDLYNAQQGHAAYTEAWKLCKAHLIAGRKLTMTIQPTKRSTKQNRRYWGGGVLSQIAAQAQVNGKRYSAEIWHEQLKRMFLGVDELPNGQVVSVSSKNLTTAEFCDYCAKVEAYAATELGVYFEDLQPWPEK